MFGNNILGTNQFGSEKVLGQGYDPLRVTDEIMIFIPGSEPGSDLSFSDSSD